MTKRRLNLRKVVAIAICLAGMTMFSGCDKGNDPNAISVADNKTLTQEVFADNVQGKSGVSFTTTGAWTSSISEVSPSTKSVQMKAGTNSPDWISISPDNGGAGDWTISITLETNTTGADRTAVITISCNGDEIKITVTQKATTQSGETPTPTTVRLVKSVDFGNGEFYEFEYDAKNRITKMINSEGNATYSYPNANTIVVTFGSETETRSLNSDGSLSSHFGEKNIPLIYDNGYLQKMMGTNEDVPTNFPDGQGGTVSAITTYTWENKNMTKRVSDIKYSSAPQHNYTRTYIYEYGILPNKATSIDLYFSFTGQGLGPVPYGLLGKSTTNFPTKCTIKRVGETDIVRTFRYETDTNGYVTKMYESYNGGKESMVDIQYK